MIQSLLFVRRIYALISREEILQPTLPNTSNTVDYEPRWNIGFKLNKIFVKLTNLFQSIIVGITISFR